MLHPTGSISAFARPKLRLAFAAVLLLPLACTDPVRFGPATKLVFTVQPSATVHDVSVTPGIVVEIHDDDGRVVRSATNSVTLEITSNPSSGTLSGTTTVNAVEGVATFTAITIDKPGLSYRLSAKAEGLTSASSSSFEIKPGLATKLAFLTQPPDVVHDQPILVTVAVQDAAGYNITSIKPFIQIRLGQNPSDAVLTGPDTATVSNGVAVFSGLRINTLGTDYTLVAFAQAALTQATSEPFDVITGPPTRLTFKTQPSSTGPSETITPAVVVTIADAGGYTVPTFTQSVSLAIGNNTGGATLSGTTTVNAVNGEATFAGLSIDNAGIGYTLVASATSLPNLTSNPFVVRVPILLASLSSGYFHGCGMGMDGKAYCWGDNQIGQGGNDADTGSPPLPVLGSQTFATVSAGREHSCGLTNIGAAFCWGGNGNGKLGIGNTTNKFTPNAVNGGLTFTQLHAGYAHTCAVSAGAGYCWGDNGAGELGVGTINTGNTSPVAVTGGLTFSTITAGRFFTCGVTTAQDAYCWGDNAFGQLGDGTQVVRSAPTLVSGGLKFAAVIAGGFHSCGLTPAGQAYCWGANDFGQVGDGTMTRRLAPTAVSTALTFTSLTVGNRHNCAITTAGAAYCWGDGGNHALGDGTSLRRTTPAAVSGGLTFASISAGRFHTCGVTTTNAAYCWGDNPSGVLGDGTFNSSPLPLRVR